MGKTKAILTSLAALTLGGLLFFNSTPAPSAMDIRDGRAPWPLTALTCASAQDFATTCKFSLAGHRPRDARVLALVNNAADPADTPYFGPREWPVTSAADFNALNGRLSPGDQIVLRAGNWSNQRIVLRANGSASRPILVRAERVGATRFSGTSSITLTGSHLFLHGVSFLGAVATSANKNAIVLGTTGSPCHGCAAVQVRIDDFNPVAAQAWAFKHNYVVVTGRDVTVSHSDFRNLRYHGNFVSVSPKETTPIRTHILRNYFADRPAPTGAPADKTNGNEVIYLGGSQVQTHQGHVLIENNLILRTGGDAEIITVKLADVILRNNTLRDNRGTLTLRHSARTLVEGNFFLGGATFPSGGGLRVIGPDHVVVNNYFEGIKGNSTNSPLVLMAGGSPAPKDGDAGYVQMRNVLVAHNTFVNCEAGIALGAGSSSRYPLQAAATTIANNFFQGITKFRPLEPYHAGAATGVSFANNVVVASLSDTVGAGARINDSVKAIAHHGQLRPLTTSRTFQNARPLASLRRPTDIDGLAAPASRADVGADEIGNQSAATARAPLSLSTLWK
mgnify:CR=1 FL=1